MFIKIFRFSLLGLVWRIWSPNVTNSSAKLMGWYFLGIYILERLMSSLNFSNKDTKLKCIYLNFLKGNVFYRPLTSDLMVMKQVFIDDQFGSANLPINAINIVDAGANCGYSALYFSWKYPSSTVFAVEPDAGNFKLLEKNSKIYSNRIHSIQGALWPNDKNVFVADLGFRGGGNWAIQVTDSKKTNESSLIPGFSPHRLFSSIGVTRVDIFKIDIEGGEVPLLLHKNRNWMDQVGCLIIELHNDVKVGNTNASQALDLALEGKECVVTHRHENTIVNFT